MLDEGISHSCLLLRQWKWQGEIFRIDKYSRCINDFYYIGWSPPPKMMDPNLVLVNVYLVFGGGSLLNIHHFLLYTFSFSLSFRLPRAHCHHTFCWETTARVLLQQNRTIPWSGNWSPSWCHPLEAKWTTPSMAQELHECNRWGGSSLSLKKPCCRRGRFLGDALAGARAEGFGALSHSMFTLADSQKYPRRFWHRASKVGGISGGGQDHSRSDSCRRAVDSTCFKPISAGQKLRVRGNLPGCSWKRHRSCRVQRPLAFCCHQKCHSIWSKTLRGFTTSYLSIMKTANIRRSSEIRLVLNLEV